MARSSDIDRRFEVSIEPDFFLVQAHGLTKRTVFQCGRDFKDHRARRTATLARILQLEYGNLAVKPGFFADNLMRKTDDLLILNNAALTQRHRKPIHCYVL